MNAGIDSFQYDSFGRRVAKTISGATTNYLYDGVNPVQELSAGTVTANLLTGLGVDEYLMRTDSSGVGDFLTDPLGSTVALADSTGAVQTSYTYEPFGNTAVSGAGSANPYQYTGRENDGTGLYFYRARYYSPNFQRFVSGDPLDLLGGNVNLYTYSFNNPIYFTDPSGRCPACIGAGIGGVIGAAIEGQKAYRCGARTDILRADTDRSVYLACGSSCGHLFLDPDTGLRMHTSRGARAPQFLFATELEKLAEQRPDHLTLVFDQCVGRGSEQLHLTAKLRELREHGVFGWAYVSHACFILAGRDRNLVAHARA